MRPYLPYPATAAVRKDRSYGVSESQRKVFRGLLEFALGVDRGGKHRVFEAVLTKGVVVQELVMPNIFKERSLQKPPKDVIALDELAVILGGYGVAQLIASVL
jgi:hypothetical protein